MRKISIILIILASIGLSATALAQESGNPAGDSDGQSVNEDKAFRKGNDNPVKTEMPSLSQEQTMLIREGINNYEKGHQETGDGLFKAVLTIAPTDLALLKVGEAYASVGSCQEAYRAFTQVAVAVPASEEWHDRIVEQAKKDAEELNQRCSARLVLNCNPSDAMISIDGGEKFKCSTDPIALKPGSHSVYGITEAGSNTITVDLTANETTRTSLWINEKAADDKDKTVKYVVDAPADWKEQSDLYWRWGWGLFGGGAAVELIGLGVMVYGIYLTEPRSSKGKAAIISGAAMTFIGGAAFFTGIGLLIANEAKFGAYRRGEVADGFQWQPELVITPEMSGFGISGRF
ncbi:MAG: hypothetical protein IJU23_15015 [Proteobacteria bacterium]|nr:hypothetical protein [Pseudomonadota bacterium]